MGKPLTDIQQTFLDVMQHKSGVLVTDVMHLIHNNRAAARNVLDTLVKKGYAKKRPIHIRVPTPFLLGSGSTHRQHFAKYYPIDTPTVSDQQAIDTPPSVS
jgi:hypothetical protein